MQKCDFVQRVISLLSVLSVAGYVQHRTSLRSSSIDFGSTVPADAVSEITNNCNITAILVRFEDLIEALGLASHGGLIKAT